MSAKTMTVWVASGIPAAVQRSLTSRSSPGRSPVIETVFPTLWPLAVS